MNTELGQVELTHAAQEALDRLAREYHERVLLLSVDIAKARMSTPVLITSEDIYEAAGFDSIELERLKGESGTRLRVFGTVLALLLIFAGLVVALMVVIRVITPTSGAGLVIFDRPAVEVLTWMGIMLGALSVIAILVALIWQASVRNSGESSGIEERKLELLARWSDFERAAIGYSAQKYGESYSAPNARRILSLPVFTNYDRDRLETALRMRNEIAHATKQHSQDELNDAIETITRATRQLVSARNVAD